MTKKITARFMIQIAGKPIENVQKALEMVLKKLKEENDTFKIVDSEILEPEFDKESTLYSGIIEATGKFEDAECLMEFILDYTPNSIEIEDPSEFKFTSAGFTALLNDMSNHFLKMNMQLRQANATIHMLNNKLNEKKK